MSLLTPGAAPKGSTDPPPPEVEVGCVLYPPEVPLAGCDWADAEIENPIATAKARGRIGNFDTKTDYNGTAFKSTDFDVGQMIACVKKETYTA